MRKFNNMKMCEATHGFACFMIALSFCHNILPVWRRVYNTDIYTDVEHFFSVDITPFQYFFFIATIRKAYN